MPGLNELAQRHTELTDADLARLGLLLADWQLIADLAFSDLVLWLPTWNTSGYIAAAQLRPTTGPTVFTEDLVGTFLPRGRRPVVDEALARGRVVTVAGALATGPERGIPVPSGARVIGVVAQHTHPSVDRARSPLEETYVEVADRLASMVAEGTFPAAGPGHDLEDSPRVGDGLLLLDAAGLVSFASPNALSAYRRLGLAADLGGASLAQISRFLSPRRGPVDEDPTAILGGRTAGNTELEAKGAVVALRTLPLLVAGRRTGALVLLRDVTDLRRRERELVTKDATIREIHHRVKNNLQTVAALLRLQARRLDAPDAVAALAVAERRVASIALVHELLSMSPDPDVPFDEICDRLLSMVTEVMGAPRVTVRREGTFGELDAELATPLALILNELAQNAVEHGLRGRAGTLVIRPLRAVDELVVAVEDDGIGLPDDFDDETSVKLGLQIARTLVADLGGQVSLSRRDAGGTAAVVCLPLN